MRSSVRSLLLLLLLLLQHGGIRSRRIGFYWTFPLTVVTVQSTRHTAHTRNSTRIADHAIAYSCYSINAKRRQRMKTDCWWGWRSSHAVPACRQCVRACSEHTSFWSERHSATATLTLVMFQVCVIDVLLVASDACRNEWIQNFKRALNWIFAFEKQRQFVCVCRISYFFFAIVPQTICDLNSMRWNRQKKENTKTVKKLNEKKSKRKRNKYIGLRVWNKWMSAMKLTGK